MTEFEEIAVALLGRVAFPPDKLRTAIVRGKKQPEAYLRGYNACDGSRTVAQTAQIVGVTSGTLVPILQQWKRMGIIFEVDGPERGRFYRHLYEVET
jgi:hypothetical protein